jgi:hypothetical protein
MARMFLKTNQNQNYRSQPEKCLSVVLEILQHIPTTPENKLFQVLAAGPLEKLSVNRVLANER